MPFFMPLIVKGLGVTGGVIGLVSAVPFACAIVGMNYWGWRSDRTGERVWHTAGALLLVTAALGGCLLIGEGHPVLTMVALSIATMSSWSVGVVFWSLPTALLTGGAAALGIAVINGVGVLSGFIGPRL
jgi:MFS family permease